MSRELSVYIGIRIGSAEFFSGILVYQSIGRMSISVVHDIKLIKAWDS